MGHQESSTADFIRHLAPLGSFCTMTAPGARRRDQECDSRRSKYRTTIGSKQWRNLCPWIPSSILLLLFAMGLSPLLQKRRHAEQGAPSSASVAATSPSSLLTFSNIFAQYPLRNQTREESPKSPLMDDDRRHECPRVCCSYFAGQRDRFWPQDMLPSRIYASRIAMAIMCFIT